MEIRLFRGKKSGDFIEKSGNFIDRNLVIRREKSGDSSIEIRLDAGLVRRQFQKAADKSAV